MTLTVITQCLRLSFGLFVIFCNLHYTVIEQYYDPANSWETEPPHFSCCSHMWAVLNISRKSLQCCLHVVTCLQYLCLPHKACWDNSSQPWIDASVVIPPPCNDWMETEIPMHHNKDWLFSSGSTRLLMAGRWPHFTSLLLAAFLLYFLCFLLHESYY